MKIDIIAWPKLSLSQKHLQGLKYDRKLKHVVKGTVHTPVKCCQIWGIDQFSRESILVFDYLPSKEMLLNVHSEPPLVKIWK